jgi:SNF2 family DNA or RNA helicase
MNFSPIIFREVSPYFLPRYHGSMVEREEKRLDYESRLPRRKKENNASCDIDVVLTTFSYFSGCKDDDRNFLRRFSYDYMVIDEAHTLKNPDSNAYQNIDKLETLHRLLLTGTPVQNSPKELMSLICFLMPFFKSASKSGWEDDEGKKNDGGVSMLEYFVSLEKKGKGGENSDAAVYRKLKQLFAPFVLRRKKEDVLSQSMPPKVRLTR